MTDFTDRVVHGDGQADTVEPCDQCGDAPESMTDEEYARIQAQEEQEAIEMVAGWPIEAQHYLERMNSAYEHVCRCLNERSDLADRAVSSLRALVRQLERIKGYSSHEEQAELRVARALVGR